MSIAKSVFQPTQSTIAQLARYVVVGGIATIADFAVLVSLTETGLMHHLVAAIFGFAAGLLTNYWISTAWVFQNHKLKNSRAEFTIFAIVGILGLGLTELILWLGTDISGIDYRMMKMVAVVVVLFWNFGARKVLLF